MYVWSVLSITWFSFIKPTFRSKKTGNEWSNAEKKESELITGGAPGGENDAMVQVKTKDLEENTLQTF